ncbi:MAG: acetyl ornithine aminotransferase family protein, partial [Acidobacteriota bacterium]|nr:acetyl ornithine aminotransferase family protein [Acidobacteriota bacterium]
MDAPLIKTALPGPKAKAIIERDGKVVSPSYTRGYPFVMARGAGAIVEDVDGNQFLDCAAGIAVNSTGHSHPAVVAAIIDQAQKFLHMSGTDFYYEPQVQLGEAFNEIAPFGGPKRSFFSNSGTEANEAAIKLARYSTGRYGMIAFIGSFHGRTLGSLALTSSKAIQRRGFGPMQAGTFHAPYATCYRCPVGLRPETCQAECLGFLEHQVLVHLISPDEVAGVLVEPIQGEGGYVVPAPQFHERLRALTKKHGILLIADEVQSGMGRTGKMFAMEHFGVEPDMITAAKGVASGLPLGVTTARAEVMDWPPGSHASTFGGNPVSCAAAMATITLLKDSLIKNAAEVGAFMMDRLKEVQQKHAIIGEVRGRGLMIGIELVKDRVTKERAVAERDQVVDACFARG